MSKDQAPYGQVQTVFDHHSEAALRATYAANRASAIMLQLMLDQQLPADPAREMELLKEAARCLSDAQRWVAVGIDGPGTPQGD